MLVETTRFGSVEISGESVYHFSSGMYGFSSVQRWAVIQHKSTSPFYWLQAVVIADVALLVTEPDKFLPGYAEEVFQAIGVEGTGKTVLCVILFDRVRKMVKANLRGPILIEPEQKTGRQYLVELPAYGTESDLLALCRKRFAAPTEGKSHVSLESKG